MLVACWSVKGGSGTTTIAGALALLGARSPAGALLVDLDGEAPAVLGLADGDGPGLLDWLAAGADVPAETLARLEQSPAPGLAVLAAGGPGGGTHVRAVADPTRVETLAAHLAADPRLVVVDCGVAGPGPERPSERGAGPTGRVTLAAVASRSLLVVRPCYLALRRALAAPLRPSAVVVIGEPGRRLTGPAVADVLGVPVAASVAVHPQVAAAVDAGLLAQRLPSRLARPLAGLVRG